MNRSSRSRWSEIRTAADPSNADWQRDLSVSQGRLGNVLLAQRDLVGALGAFRKSLTRIEKLAATDPSNAGWQRDLWASHSKVGDVLLAQGDLVEALGAFRKSLALSEKLVTVDPCNAGWQRDLWVSYLKIAQTVEQTGAGGASSFWKKAFDQLSGIERRGLFMSPEDQRALDWLRRKCDE